MIRSRLLAAAALSLMTAGAAAAQPAPPASSAPRNPGAVTPMTPMAGQVPSAPTAPPATGSQSGATVSGTATDAEPVKAFSAISPAAGADTPAVLAASGQFTTFLKAADATGLTPVLKTQGLTVFAPTDAAFAALPAGTLDNLMKQENLPQLQKLLTYHLVNAKIPPIKGHAATPVTTAAGPKVTLDGMGDQVKINDATALQSQVATSTGLLYPIDKVLSPDYVPPPAPPAEAAAATEEKAATTTTKKTTTTRKKR